MSEPNRRVQWVVMARFHGKTKEMLNLPRYNEFKRRMIMSVESCKERDFDDGTMTFRHVCARPTDMFEYYYALNPMPGDDILDDADVEIYRQVNPVVGTKKSGSNKTAPITKEVKKHENEKR